MVTKRIRIEFADPTIKAYDHVQDICEAIENARRNLHIRHKVELRRLVSKSYNHDKVVIVKLEIPDLIADSFAIGNHLRGISKYLLSQFGNKYQKHLVGKRLLYYIS